MKTIQKGYYYLFYKLYKWYERGPSVWWSDWKADLSIDVLSFFFIFSIFVYYKVFIDKYFRFGDNSLVVILFILSICVPNYFIFHYRDQWKDIVKEFDKLPERKNKIGGWIVFGVVLLIISNMVFTFYLMSLIDWSPYR
jgi:hypothetical protein